MNASCSTAKSLNDGDNLCEDPETRGFDLQAGESWIYPTNYSVRDYQYNIIQEALHKNTLVSLPTGLGKTFIAAVVMYNFYRWYPHGKVIFMAPTRPLVKQQMDACYNITAIPKEVTAELTGTKVQQSRTEIWQSKRVFFITPQVLQNDLNIIIELGVEIKCLVFDEAHRAKGNHAYCEVIRKLLPTNKLFRVLALSATPGNSSKDVIDVMQNLLIAHVEFRNEESPDVKPYVFERALETVVVPLGEKLQQIKDEYVQILDKYTRTLIQHKVIYGNCGNLTKGKIFMVMKEFQAKNSGNRTPNYAEIMKSLNICVTLYHAYETLIRCGLRAFLNFYEEHINNPLLSGNVHLRQILEDLSEYLGPKVEVQPLPDGTFPKIPATTKFGHPKFYKLRDILLAHFNNCEASTRVIVFFEYRESVSEAYCLLSQSHPLIRSRVFVGQGSGVTQKNQIITIKAFREGTCNTLLSTCIGEEGLDVGDVDLIVCFDIANKSPIRMIQRMGRTGRKKEGRVIVLVTEGKEQQTLKDCLIYKHNLGNFVSNSEQLEAGKYLENPKMIPSYVQPKCQKMFITVQNATLNKKNTLKDMLKKISSDRIKMNDDFEIVEIDERIKHEVENFWDKEHPLQFEFEQPKINFTKYLEKQRTFQESSVIKHSKQTEIFVSLLQSADSKRFNLPVTQLSGNFSQNKILKQGDIRNLFARPASSVPSSRETFFPPSQQPNLDKEMNITHFPTELFEEISTYLSITESTKQACKTCEFLFKCKTVECQDSEKINLSTWTLPDLSILDNITLSDVEIFADSLSPKSKNKYQDLLEIDSDMFEDISFSKDIKEKSLSYETPRNFDKILESFRLQEHDDVESKKLTEKSFAYETPKTFGKVLNLLVKEELNEKTSVQECLQDLLEFFKLSSLMDIFTEEKEDLDATLIYTPEVIEKSQTKVSPDLFEESPDLFSCSSPDRASPTLSSYEKIQTLKAKKTLFTQSNTAEVTKKPNLSNLNLQRKSFFESTRVKTPLKNNQKPVLDVSDICDLSSFMGENSKIEPQKKETDALDISDLCDLSIFGLTEGNNVQPLNAKKQNDPQPVQKSTVQDLKIDELCDISQIFGEPFEQKNDNATTKTDKFSELNDFCDFSSFLNTPTQKTDLTQSNKTQNQPQQKPEKCVIDLTSDNEFEVSPPKPTQNKVPSQLSISQMLGVIAKTSKNSQKENTSTPKAKTSQKLKKGILQLKQNIDSPKVTQKKVRNDNTPKKKKSKFNISLAGNSDDEFENTFVSPTVTKTKPLPCQSRKNSVVKPTKKRKKLFCDFIEEEAQVSEDERIIISEDEESGEDCFESSFVADETQSCLNDTTMHAKYLQSVKSPMRKGVFKIPEKFKHNITNVFSQAVDNEDNSYVNDSFCVGSQEMESTRRHDLSELEVLEMKLKLNRKNKKRKNAEEGKVAKRRRIIERSDSSD